MVWTQVIHGALELVILFIILELFQRRRELGYHPLDLHKAPRPLKPRSPRDCPVCRRPHPKPVWGHAHHLGVEPWPRRKSPRGKPKQICTAGHGCPNPLCAYWGNTDPTFHALVGNGLRHGIQQLRERG